MLWNLKREVAGVYHLLPDTIDLVTEDKGVAASRLRGESIKLNRVYGLLYGNNGVAFFLKAANKSNHILDMLEWNHLFRSKGNLSEFRRRWNGAYPAKIYLVNAKCIGRPESRAGIVGAAYIVQHENKTAFRSLGVLFRGNAPEFYVKEFTVLHIAKLMIFRYICKLGKHNVMKQDIQIFDLIKKEYERQSSGLELIASENYVSKQVMEAMGSICTNKYAEGYPGKRYYGGCGVVDQIEQIAIDRLCKLFDAEYANVQPHSGAQANMAVIMACLRPGDCFMGLDLSMGGHLTHGSPVNASGILYKPVAYGLDPETGLVDYDDMERKALEHKPKLIIGGASAYSREWDYERMRAIADKVGALLWIDMAHTAGLIAAGLLKNPVKYAHIVTSTTHKTLRGPRGGVILLGKDFDNPWGLTTPKGEIKKMSAILNSSVFPGVQGGPLEHVIAAKAVAFYEALQPEYVEYQKQVILNAATMCKAFIDKGYKIISGGTDNHLMLIDLRTKFPDLTGRVAENELGRADITVNKNMVPFDSRSAFATSGLRIGTPAITSRGFEEKDMIAIVDLIDTVLASANAHFAALSAKEPTEQQLAERIAHKLICDEVRRKVQMMTSGRPLNRY